MAYYRAKKRTYRRRRTYRRKYGKRAYRKTYGRKSYKKRSYKRKYGRRGYKRKGFALKPYTRTTIPPLTLQKVDSETLAHAIAINAIARDFKKEAEKMEEDGFETLDAQTINELKKRKIEEDVEAAMKASKRPTPVTPETPP